VLKIDSIEKTGRGSGSQGGNLSLNYQGNQADHHPDNHQVGKVTDKIGKYHQNDATNQEYVISGFFAVQKITEPDNTEKDNRYNPINRRMAHAGVDDLFDGDTLPEVV
jgi:hypothetical protein